ncbi:Gfo/Idh/MocA family oxidoreductase [Aureliella helgolandensis]|uniref:UDP-2-acetamido-3-amino-2, 3-dideoxy-D-glucuronate N-acetyltransferase n=1 Tax=Aureliella helgolandensis TaxID=2527968 RepID=A0A518GC53_9BACT|nr:Gfo/Idh/MocA family oxidoreductase [Aureliella helgolandensis]QDV26127.1 UDP-2-acetamido-3-amino-2,3-dideoxy-D-glucuronate N-acetyltransferase [Aureliella helgolandensis]
MAVCDVALVGAGYWGKNLARNFNGLGVLHTLCDASEKTLASYGEEYSSVERQNSFDAVLCNPQIKKVAFATPAPTHFKLAKAALLAGKDVYVEKPLCLCAREAQELIDLAAKAERILMVGHLLQYHPCVEKLTAMVRAGELGKLFYITSNRLNLGKIRQEENSLWSFAPHDISVILGLAGAVPSSVVCHGESYLTHGVADTTLTQLKFGSGLRAHVHVSWLNPFKEQKLTVVGSEGMAVFDDTRPWIEKLVVYRNYLTWTDGNFPSVNKRDAEPVVVEQSEPLKNECQHFISSCDARSLPRTDGAEGLRVLEVLNAAQQSLESEGTAIQLQPATPALSFFAHPTAIIDPRASIGEGTKIWHFSHVSDDAELGNNCNLGQNVFIASDVTVGSNVKIQNNVSVYKGTTIEDDVFLGPSCVLTNVSNPRCEINRKSVYEKTRLRRGATIGANATIVCGVTVGRFAFVAAGAVVTKDIPDYGYVRGIPAKQVGWMSRHGHPLQFSADGQAVCPESELKYRLERDPQGGETVRCEDISEETEIPPALSVGTKAYREY